MPEGTEALTALHTKISEHEKNNTPLCLDEVEVELLKDALTVRYNTIDLFNRLRCSVPEMPGEGATDDEQKEIEKIQEILKDYKGYPPLQPPPHPELKLTGKQEEVTLKAISTKASKMKFSDSGKEASS